MRSARSGWPPVTALLAVLTAGLLTPPGALAATHKPSRSGKLTAPVARCVERQGLFRGADGDSSGLRIEPADLTGDFFKSIAAAAPGVSPARLLSVSGVVKGANPYDQSQVYVDMVGVQAGQNKPTGALLDTALSAIRAQGGSWDYEHDYEGDEVPASTLRSGALLVEVRGSTAGRRAALRAVRHCVGGLRAASTPKAPALDVPKATACLAGGLPDLRADLLSDTHGLADWYGTIRASADQSIDLRSWPDGPQAGWKSVLGQGYAYLLSFSSARGVAAVAADLNARVQAGAFSSNFGLDEDATGAIAQGSTLLVGFGGDPGALVGPVAACGL